MPTALQITASKKKAKELAKYLRKERPDYNYLKSLFKYLREELEIEVPRNARKLPYVPTEDIKKKLYIMYNFFYYLLIFEIIFSIYLYLKNSNTKYNYISPFSIGKQTVILVPISSLLKTVKYPL